MTDEEITALAREYAVEVTKPDAGDPNLSDKELNEIRQTVADYAADVFRWLSYRYYIVEKEKVKEYYEDAAEYIADYKGEGMWGLEAADPTMCERAKGQKQILLRLFGKELFKDEEI